MANALRVLAYLPRRPYESVARSRNRSEIERLVADLKAQGFEAKLTRLRVGPRRSPWFEYLAWKREKPNPV